METDTIYIDVVFSKYEIKSCFYICGILIKSKLFLLSEQKFAYIPPSKTFVESWSHSGVHDLPVFLSDGPVLLEICIATLLEYPQVYLSSPLHLPLFQPAIA